MKEPDRNMHKAGLGARAVACGIDLLSVYMIVRIGMAILQHFSVFDYYELFIFLFAVAYCTVFMGGKGKTIGKALLGLRVRCAKGTPISYARGFLRETLGKLISSSFLFLGFIWIAISRSKRGWHDYIMGTVVTKEHQPTKKTLVIAVLIYSILGCWVGAKTVKLIYLHATNVLAADAVDVKDITRSDYPRYVGHLQEKAKSPIDYIVGKFREHDAIIIGEGHRVRENCEFISALMGPLYHKAGVRYLAMEFIKYKNTALVNQLVTSDQFDNKMVIRIFQDYIFPSWGYKEYMDVVKAVWEVNRKLPSSAEKLKVIGLDTNANGWHMYLQSVRTIDDIIKLLGRDRYMASVVSKEIMNKGGKALIYVGAHHDFTHYRQPIIGGGTFLLERSPRCGHILHDNFGNRVFHVAMHRKHELADAQGNNSDAKAQGTLVEFLETIFSLNNNDPVGFDVDGSPFADLRDENSYYFAHQKYVTFAAIARGYVFLKPIRELRKVTWVDGFVDESNFENWTRRGLRHRWLKSGECKTPDELNAKVRSVQHSLGLVEP